VVFHRFDASMLILNQVERDVAERRDGGLVHPRPAESSDSVGVKGIY
jgi:hypothetical protein